MKHRKGIDLVRDGADVGYTVGEGSSRGSEPPDAPYRVEVWTDPPEAGGTLLETISRSMVFAVSCAALKAAIRERPGKSPCPSQPKASHHVRARAGSAAPGVPAAKPSAGAAAEETLDRLPEWYALVGTCPSCRRSGPVERRDIIRVMGRKAVLSAIPARLRCKGCTNKSGNKLTIKKLPR